MSYTSVRCTNVRRDHQPLLHFSHAAPPEIYTLSLHDALPIWSSKRSRSRTFSTPACRTRRRTTRTSSRPWTRRRRSEEHTSELQSRGHLVCRLLLEKKNRHKEGPAIQQLNGERKNARTPSATR